MGIKTSRPPGGFLMSLLATFGRAGCVFGRRAFRGVAAVGAVAAAPRRFTFGLAPQQQENGCSPDQDCGNNYRVFHRAITLNEAQ
jgi:hypothetical protein